MGDELARVARALKARAERALEAERFSEGAERPLGLPRLPFEEFRRAMRLKAALLQAFRGARLHELYATRERRNEHGTCLAIVHRLSLEAGAPISPSRLKEALDAERSAAALRAELRLLRGVGPWWAARLRAQGVRSLDDLKGHPRWGREAAELLDRLRRRDVRALQGAVRRGLPASHPLQLRLLGLVPPARLRWLDLETLGLFGRPAVLLGVARLEGDAETPCFEITQYLARDITEELPALVELRRDLGEGPALISYNGRAFDAHVVEERLSYYGLLVAEDPLDGALHVDLLPHARRRFQGELPDLRLETVERRLGLERPLDVPSALVPDFYNTYLETGNVGALVPIIEHNKHDLVALLALLGELMLAPARAP